MKMLVLGAGLQGCACAYDLLQNQAISQVTLADLRPDNLPRFLAGDWEGRLRVVRLDVTDPDAVHQTLHGHSAVMSAIPYYYNGPMARAAVEAGCHFSDLGGNTEIVLEQKKLDDQALAEMQAAYCVSRGSERLRQELFAFYRRLGAPPPPLPKGTRP